MKTFKDELTKIIYKKLSECPEKKIVENFKEYAINTLSGNKDEVCSILVYYFSEPLEDKDVRCVRMILAIELPGIKINVNNNAIMLDPIELLPKI